jgi:hypothetical protein
VKKMARPAVNETRTGTSSTSVVIRKIYGSVERKSKRVFGVQDSNSLPVVEGSREPEERGVGKGSMLRFQV